jgi:hypothetical protein
MKTASKKRPYVGIKHPAKTEIVKSENPVTKQTHPQFHTVKGPFRTNKGAKFLANHANPKAMSNISISELERLAANSNDSDMGDSIGSELEDGYTS